MPRRVLRSYPTKLCDRSEPMRNGPPSRRSSPPRRPTAAVRPTSIAARSSTPCWTNIARAANGACVRTMFRRCVRFAPISTNGIVMEHASKSMIPCANWRDARWTATRSHPSASWTPNPSKRPKQVGNAAMMEEKRSTGANGNSGLMWMGSWRLWRDCLRAAKLFG